MNDSPSSTIPAGAPASQCDSHVPLAIVLVNYRTPDVTIRCLETLAPEIASVPGTQVVVVDNASGDGSAERMAEAVRDRGWGGWARIVPAAKNGGFAYGNNRGIDAAGPALHVLLLNNDTLVRPGCLAHCLRVMDSDPSIGAMSCKLLNVDGTLQRAGRRFPNPLRIALGATGLPWKLPRLFGWAQVEYTDWDQTKDAGDADWLGGAFLWVRGDLMRRLVGLDESFFFYGEDIEFCHRVWREGLRCRYDPGAAVVHLGGASSDSGRLDPSARSLHAWRGRYMVQRRCWGAFAALFARGVDLAHCAARVAWMTLTGRRGTDAFRAARANLAILSHPLGRAP